MSSHSYAKELHLASLAVQRAALLTKQLLSAVDKGSFDKIDATPVTIADFAAQASIIAAIHNTFPDDDIIGEEDSTALRENPTLLERTWELATTVHLDDEASEALLYTPRTRDEMLDLIDLGAKGRCGRTGRVWTLDPVDGTATFMQGQQYAVCLALVEDGTQRLGVLGCPNLRLDEGPVSEETVDRDGLGQMLAAVAGQGVTIRPMGPGQLLPSKPLVAVEQVVDASAVRFVDTRAASSHDLECHGRVAAQLGCPWPNPVDLWSAQMRYIAIAVRGGCNAFIKVPRSEDYRSKIWDHAGGMLLVQELGCAVTDLEGRPVDCGLGRTLADCHGMIVAPVSIHAQIVEAVRIVRQTR
ncbi:Myo-inositol-1(Or 4)-monophosphatase [Penicillium macrosclerotiorum]|uniref:Myo-inositol-1(Or 4)-monophosphatase n=1 Tax=Penicillium macrosclerotiorum TaxID=303699 RepID=UPI002546EB0A|nr:Myo-inositol-1(Or 4)-monophosphatase [Penicillium macrosclerotiorum]KAJ5675763.1 Myo-inositol-1(Or 4)-monophosphatase [Penicillium macrosclerotiorum]